MSTQKAAQWSQGAERLAALLPQTRLHRAVLAWASAPGRRGPWVVALSGGADSVALLLLLWAHWPQRRSRLRAVHFNHRLRGRAADRDEAFCRRVCRALGVELWVGRRRLAEKIQGEAGARELRFAFIEKQLRTHRAKALWLGHQQNDVAESMLMRLARGSGTAGLAAPRPVHLLPGGRVQLRPLLDLKHEEIVAALGALRLSWREDATNAGGDFFRNRVRNEVLPVWLKSAGRDAVAGAALARDLLDEDDAALELWADRLQAGMPRGRLDLSMLKDVPRAVGRRLLRRWLNGQPGAAGLSRQAFELLLDAVEQGKPTRHSLGGQGFAVIRRRELYFERKRALSGNHA
jgi:tRNA(Ile)-lysidine synthase